MVIDELAEINRIVLAKKKFYAVVGEGTISGVPVLLSKPQTYMNLSGTSVRELACFLKLDPTDLIVVHDDLDLDPEIVRVKVGGGAGGHKGLQSVIENLGSAAFIRIRLGIGKPAVKEMIEGYVLDHFRKDELEGVAKAVQLACGAVEEIVSSGVQSAMSKFNLRGKSRRGGVGGND
jgi:PTH1 family peptidyl-tRNA hydrolase